MKRSNQPLLLAGFIDDWPAVSQWSLDRLRSLLKGRFVPVEVGAHYLADGWSQKLIEGSTFVEEWVCGGKKGSAGTSSGHIDSDSLTTCSPYSDSESVPIRPKGYLAQHDLFAQLPQLKNDIYVPDYCYWDEKDEEDQEQGDEGSEGADNEITISAWFGPSGTISPLHTDPRHNLFGQVLGSKYIRLYAPDETCNLYPHEESMVANSSQVDAENPDHSKFPLFATAKFVDCIVRPGDMLFIPVKYQFSLFFGCFKRLIL